MLTEEGKIFLDEQLEIRRLAMDGPAIFLGHCASEALRDQKGVIKVFIRSSDDQEVKKRIEEDYRSPKIKWNPPADITIKNERDTTGPTREMTGRISRTMISFWIPRCWESMDV